MEGVSTGDRCDWAEERAPGLRRWVCSRPSGYEARVVAREGEVAARLWRPHEAKDTLVELREVRPEDVERTVAELQQVIEQRLVELESGHS